MPFQVLEISIDVIRELRTALDTIARKDRDLASQIRRALSSSPLNISEGSERIGRDQAHHYRIAAGSSKEARTGLRVAEAFGYVSSDRVELGKQMLTSVLKMLFSLTR